MRCAMSHIMNRCCPVLQVGVSDGLYHFIHDLWLENQPIGELS